jgi:predicted MFS family arabinose efflux permease
MMTKPTESAAAEMPDRLQQEPPPASWSGVFAMTLCVFALIASEFMPVSLLTPLADDLRISEGMAGQGISVSGAFAVVTSLLISKLAGSVNRKPLLLWLTALMCLSGVIIALAPNFTVYMVGRALIGVVVGGFWSLSAAVAMRLVPPHRVPRALAIFNGGNALATVVAAPLGSYLGAAVGWRGAFFSLVPVALIALVWQWISLPDMKPEQRSAAAPLTLLKRPAVAMGLAGVGVFFMGQFALFTYLRPFLEAVTRVDVSTLSFILLTIGVCGFIGATAIGGFLEAGFYRTLITIPLVMAGIAIALIGFGEHVPAVTVLLGCWGLVATAAPVGWWLWVARTLPNEAEAGGGLMVAVIQLSIALGSAAGGLLFDVGGYGSAFVFSAAGLLLASLLAFLTSRSGRLQTK